jgi:YggT family protein
MDDSLGTWLFQVPNLVIAAIMYTLLGRFLLSLFIPETSEKVIMVVFRQITEPVMVAVRAITPFAVPERVVLLFAFLWLLALRVVLYVGLRIYGLTPSIAG